MQKQTKMTTPLIQTKTPHQKAELHKHRATTMTTAEKTNNTSKTLKKDMHY